MSYLIYLLAFVGILGLAINLHELGHFLVAKLLGMRVEAYSFFGLGPRLWGFKIGHTDYRVSAIPLGAYVKLYGDESNAVLEGADTHNENVPKSELFELRPRWQKFLVMVAGPAMNILTALAVAWGGAMLNGVPVSLNSPVIRMVKPGGVGESAGLREGDRIVAFNGQENPSWERILDDAHLNPEQPLPLTVERDGRRLQLSVKPTKVEVDGDQMGDIDFSPDYGDRPVVVSDVVQGSAAEQAGVKINDRVLAVNGEPVRDDFDVRAKVSAHKNDQVRLTLQRGGHTQEVTARTNAEGKLGFVPTSVVPYQSVGPVAAVGYAVRNNLRVLRMTGAAFGQIFKGERSASKSLSGPIGIARASASAVEKFGWAGFFGMLGFLSLNLGIVNLLPIPLLDGGAIFLLFIEAALGWIGLKMSQALRERIQQVGFVVLLLLMGFVITNDLVKTASLWRGGGDDKPAATSTR